MTPAQASAQICACLESATGKLVENDGEAEVLEWCNGNARSGKPRPELLETPEGETLLKLMIRRLRTTKTAGGELAANGILAFRGAWDARAIQSLTLALDSDTRLCNGDDG